MGSLTPEPNPYVGTVEVRPSTSTACCRRGVNLIVCDVEGAEAGLFDGADLAGVDRILIELHDHVTGLSGVRRALRHHGDHGFAYDPRHSPAA